MRALIKPGPGPGLELVERPKPDVGPADVLIAVKRAAICGTDLHIFDWDDWAACISALGSLGLHGIEAPASATTRKILHQHGQVLDLPSPPLFRALSVSLPANEAAKLAWG